MARFMAFIICPLEIQPLFIKHLKDSCQDFSMKQETNRGHQLRHFSLMQQEMLLLKSDKVNMKRMDEQVCTQPVGELEVMLEKEKILSQGIISLINKELLMMMEHLG